MPRMPAPDDGAVCARAGRRVPPGLLPVRGLRQGGGEQVLFRDGGHGGGAGAALPAVRDGLLPAAGPAVQPVRRGAARELHHRAGGQVPRGALYLLRVPDRVWPAGQLLRARGQGVLPLPLQHALCDPVHGVRHGDPQAVRGDQPEQCRRALAPRVLHDPPVLEDQAGAAAGAARRVGGRDGAAADARRALAAAGGRAADRGGGAAARGAGARGARDARVPAAAAARHGAARVYHLAGALDV